MMNAIDIGTVLAKAAAFDRRRVDEADVLAWLEAVGDLPLDDALAAVTRHYQHSTEWLKPAHLRQEVLAIHAERFSHQHSEVIDLPSRFELDDLRDERVRRGVAQLASVLPTPDIDSTDPHERARARGKIQRAGRPIPGQSRNRRTGGKPADLAKIPGPAWTEPGAREQASIAALHAAGRTCGRRACTEPACNTIKEAA